MNIESVRLYCLSKKAATEDFPFDETTLVFRLMGKIFVAVDLEKPFLLVAKCDPAYALELREQYEGIEGAWHWNKKYWNQIQLESDVSDALIRQLIDHAYEEVFKKLTRKQKEAYASEPEQSTD